MKRKFLLLFCLLVVLLNFCSAQIPSRYVYFQGDSLLGLNVDSLYQQAKGYGNIHHLNDAELGQSLLIKEKGFVYTKYHLPQPLIKQIDPNKNISATSACNNVDFENGNFNGWTGFTGFNSNSSSPLAVLGNGVSTLGLNSNESTCSYHTLVTAAAGNDYMGGFPELDPGGGSYACRLGGYNINMDNRFGCTNTGILGVSPGEILEQTFVVTPSNSLFTYKYAILLNDGGHPVGEQPYFMIEVLDSAGNTIPCLQYYIQILSGVVPANFLPSKHVNRYDNTNVYYLPWSANSLNLATYMGKTITVRFTAAGCTHGGHFGYGYVDCSCSPVEINLSSPTACQGSTISLTAPPGADSYNWVKVPAGTGIVGPTNNQTCIVNTSGIYSVTITTGACSYTIDTVVTIYPFPIIRDSAQQVTCSGLSNGSATAIVTGVSSPFTFSWSTIPVQHASTVSGLTPGTYTVSVTAPGGCVSSSTVVISQPTLLTAGEKHLNLSCNGSNNGFIKVIGTGGTAPYTYLWTPGGATIDSISNVPSGTYQCIVTDANNCKFTEAVTITQPPPIALSIIGKNISCYGGKDGMAIATGSGGTSPLSYSWSPGALTKDTIQNLYANIYLCTIKDANGCLDTQSVRIVQPDAPIGVQVYVHPVSCNNGADGVAAVTAAGGTAPYAYQWSPGGSTSDTIKSIIAQSYTCTITDSHGCVNVVSFPVSQPSSLTANTISTPVSCNGGRDGMATVTVAGGNGTYQYSWLTGGTGSTVSGLPSGTDTCWIKDGNGCRLIAVIQITQPPKLSVSGSVVDATCGLSNGSTSVTVSGGKGAYTYSWSPVPGSSSGLLNLHPGSYSCMVTDSNHCGLQIPLSVINIGNLPVATISPSGPPTFCYGANITLTASGGTTYSWSNGSLTPSITLNTSGKYEVYVSNSCGTDSASIVLNVLPLPVPNISGANKICLGDSTKLTATGGGTYHWSNGSIAPSIYVKDQGTYTVIVTNGCGSVNATETVQVNNANALYTITPTSGPAPLTVTFENKSSASSVSWLWNLGDNSSYNGAFTFDHTYTTPGIYTTSLHVNDSNGCTGKFEILVDVLEPPSLIKVPNVFTPNNDGTNDLFVVHSENLASLNMKIYDRWGVFVAELTSPQQGWDGFTAGGSKASDGTYYYLLQAAGLDGKNYQFQGFFMLLQ